MSFSFGSVLNWAQGRLSPGEIRRSDQSPADNVDIGVLITKLTSEMPREEDVRRIRAKLAGAGWPLADVA